jgi:hypothetical protein
MEKIQGITNKQFTALVVLMILISLGTICITNYIGNKRVQQNELDSTDFKLLKSFIEKKLIKDRIKKHDSIDKVLVKLDTIFVDRWHKAKAIASAAPDTCQHYIQLLVHACDSMKMIKDSINKNLRIKIEEHKAHGIKDSLDIVLLYSEKSKADSTIFSLENKLEKAIKQKKWWRNAALIEGGYIILRESKSIIVN